MEIELITIWLFRVISAILILVAGYAIGQWLNTTIKKINKLDETLRSFLGGLAKYAVLAIAIITVLSQFGVQTASLIAVLGAAGLAIGLALQGTLSNVAAGVMLLIIRPFNVGDYITVGNVGGTVKSLSLFGTELATPDNVYIFAPNGQIWNQEIHNYSRNTERRMDITVSISYRDDIDKAMNVLMDTLNKDERVLKTEGSEPQVMVGELGNSSVDLIVRFWCGNADYWNLKWDLTKAIKKVLDQNNITIPFPTQSLEIISSPTENSDQKAA